MSRLHVFAANLADVARRFGVAEVPSFDLPPGTSEGLCGTVVIERGKCRLLKRATWGFPRITHEIRERDELPGRIGLVADLTSPFWEQLVVDPRYRCLIPITHFANPVGVPGEKTRTWFSVKDQPITAWAGFCRGPVYAGMTMTANAAVESTNDRMPVLLDPEQHERWLHGSIRDVIAFQFGAPIAAERMIVERTEDLWRSGGLPGSAKSQLSLL
jgi:putative SOS response-associated peptidase YedK